MAAFTIDDVKAVRKPRDSWWTVFLVDPLACRLTLFIANRTAVTPNGVTRLSILLGLASAACFGVRELAAGAALFYLSFVVDCVDGKLARLKGTGTPFGLWLDYVGDRLRVACCAAGLACGQYAVTGDPAYPLMGGAVVLLDLFRYINGPQLKRVREATREQARATASRRWSAECVFVEDILSRSPQTGVRDLLSGGPVPGDGEGGRGPVGAVVPDGRPLIDLHARFRARFPWFDRFRRALARRRVRTHVMSGIEYHAAVFVIAPLAGPAALLPVAVAGSLLLVLFEAGLVYRMWLATREITRVAAAPYPTHLIAGQAGAQVIAALPQQRTAQQTTPHLTVVPDPKEGVLA